MIRRAHELADFVDAAAARYESDPERVIAVGYSNGANIAAAILLLRPEVLSGAILFRAMVPLVPPVLAESGSCAHFAFFRRSRSDRAAENAERLAAMLREAGATVTSRFEPAGHSLGLGDIKAAKEWLANQ